jgi:ParB family chromosome partitioning protein
VSNPSFSLKKPTANSALFMPSDSLMANNGNNIVNIATDKLKHYCNHPFKLYEGERLDDMVESIKANGILIPLLVRPLAEGDYEVLAGHNRLEGGKIAGMSIVPCIIKEDLTDEEAHLIVTESNLVQRSFADLSHSERAEALFNHYNAIKHQGKRTDLIRQVEALLNGEMADNFENAERNIGTPSGNKSIEVTGAKYGLSKNSVARYIRINNLISGFKEMLDNEELAIRAGVSLSFIGEERQHSILDQSTNFGVGISMKQAEKLRQLNADMPPDNDPDDEAFLHGSADILIGKPSKENEALPKKIIRFKLDRSAVAPYFKEDDTEEMIQETILEALQFFHQFRGKFPEA